MKKIIFIVSALIVFTAFNYGIYQKEEIRANGEIMFLELMPDDPRSLLQGDYMQLHYAIESIKNSDPLTEKSKYIVVAIDQNKVGKFGRFYKGEALVANEKLLHYHNNYGNIRIRPNSFMFQEGQSQHYQHAKYGVFKFDRKGNYILIGLADNNLQVIQVKL